MSTLGEQANVPYRLSKTINETIFIRDSNRQFIAVSTRQFAIDKGYQPSVEYFEELLQLKLGSKDSLRYLDLALRDYPVIFDDRNPLTGIITEHVFAFGCHPTLVQLVINHFRALVHGLKGSVMTPDKTTRAKKCDNQDLCVADYSLLGCTFFHKNIASDEELLPVTVRKLIMRNRISADAGLCCVDGKDCQTFLKGACCYNHTLFDAVEVWLKEGDEILPNFVPNFELEWMKTIPIAMPKQMHTYKRTQVWQEGEPIISPRIAHAIGNCEELYKSVDFSNVNENYLVYYCKLKTPVATIAEKPAQVA
mgnify:CR=1 FL=1